jgi:glyoxylase-like metal-dependent hydrolase (beta-lactamase superfamily II)
MKQLTDTVFFHEVQVTGFSVACALVLTPRRAIVFDTLTRAEDMRPIAALVNQHRDGRRVLVVNSHHHWDHVYGNAAFADEDIVAHRSCRKLMASRSYAEDESIPLPPTEGVPLPTIAFGDRVTFADDGGTLHLIHTPGHSEDSLVAYYEAARLLLAGDTVEWPLPHLCQRDGFASYVRTLRQLKQLPVTRILPGHGPVMGKEIIDANQRYLEGLYEAVRGAKENGVSRHELALPAEWFLPEGVELNEFYAEAHQANVEWAFDEV